MWIWKLIKSEWILNLKVTDDQALNLCSLILRNLSKVLTTLYKSVPSLHHRLFFTCKTLIQVSNKKFFSVVKDIEGRCHRLMRRNLCVETVIKHKQTYKQGQPQKWWGSLSTNHFTSNGEQHSESLSPLSESAFEDLFRVISEDSSSCWTENNFLKPERKGFSILVTVFWHFVYLIYKHRFTSTYCTPFCLPQT